MSYVIDEEEAERLVLRINALLLAGDVHNAARVAIAGGFIALSLRLDVCPAIAFELLRTQAERYAAPHRHPTPASPASPPKDTR